MLLNTVNISGGDGNGGMEMEKEMNKVEGSSIGRERCARKPSNTSSMIVY